MPKKLNVKLFEQIKQAILANPEEFDMNSWFGVNPAAKCGTTACISGWAQYLGNKNVQKAYEKMICKMSPEEFRVGFEYYVKNELSVDFHNDSANLLGIHEDISNNLFFVYYWYHPFRTWFESAKTAKEQAIIAAKYLDFFVANYDLILKDKNVHTN